ncbi:hypothetical protein ACFE04_030740 [Oxalis oulophora]
MKRTRVASSSSTSRRSRNWLDLPDEVTAKILVKLGPVDILESAQKVCLSWRRICKEASMWRHVKFSDLAYLRYHGLDLVKMCRHIVDRSDGQLIEVHIERFATDKLLHYISERSSGLKRLRLIACFDITTHGMVKAATKLPLLEELELTYCTLISKKAVEVIGKSCRLLNSFKVNRHLSYSYNGCDDEALAIAENMCGLHHLQLVGNRLTNNGLQAILKACPQLESLDLRRCVHLCLKGNLKKTCADQVKSLKLPGASIDDFPYFGYEYDSDDDDYQYGGDDIELSYDFGDRDDYYY